jgi:hypothetical protein
MIQLRTGNYFAFKCNIWAFVWNYEIMNILINERTQVRANRSFYLFHLTEIPQQMDVYEWWIGNDVEIGTRGTYLPIAQSLSRKDCGEPQETCRNSWPLAEYLNWDLWNMKQCLKPHKFWLSCSKRITEAGSVWNPCSVRNCIVTTLATQQLEWKLNSGIKSAHRIWSWKFLRSREIRITTKIWPSSPSFRSVSFKLQKLYPKKISEGNNEK